MRKGDAVEAKYLAAKYGAARTKWYAGTIVDGPHPDGSFDIAYAGTPALASFFLTARRSMRSHNALFAPHACHNTRNTSTQ